MQNLVEQNQIIRVLNLYAQACDRKDWDLFRELFDVNIQANYGGFEFNGCDEVIEIIKGNLGGCGPTQHLLSNHIIDVIGSQAASSCYVRASHAGGLNKETLFFEVWGEYKDQLHKVDGQWLIKERQMIIYHEIGTREVLAPEHQ